MMVSFVLSFFPRDVLDEILNLIESVSEDFPSYSWVHYEPENIAFCCKKIFFLIQRLDFENSSWTFFFLFVNENILGSYNRIVSMRRF